MIVAAAAAAVECKIQTVLILLTTTKTTLLWPSTRMRRWTIRNPRRVEPKISADLRWRSFVGTSEEPEVAVELFCHCGGQGCGSLDGRGPSALILAGLDPFESLHLLYQAEGPASPPGPSGPLNWDRPPPLDRNFLAPLQYQTSIVQSLFLIILLLQFIYFKKIRSCIYLKCKR